MNSKLGLSEQKIARARELAAAITEPVQAHITGHTTVTVERATLRMLGADGVNADEVPVPNLLVDAFSDRCAQGVARPYISTLLARDWTPADLNKAVADGCELGRVQPADDAAVRARAAELTGATFERIAQNVTTRNERMARYAANEKSPLLYLIVATGNIHEDVNQAQAAVQQGADIVAVIRATAQSLLDYVPHGATTEGFGGTYATQENFRIMRAALDEAGARQQRYVRLVNYCSGLCMPEIAAMGAFERLDMMLNDSMYGVLFRDINMYRTFVDQHFSRMINALADVVINTGEDNYLTTANAYEKAHTVLASQLINERFARSAGLPPRLIGLGHAFEIDPDMKNSFLYELAQAQMAREIFPELPLKYMPPTKFMSGDIFRSYAIQTMFNFASKATGQSIHLLGMLTEAIHTPFLHDRYLALENAEYVMNAMADLGGELEFKKDGLMVRRAEQVLDRTLEFLEQIATIGLFDAIEQGLFADISRSRTGGKGADGVVAKKDDYWNPVEDALKHALGLGA